MKTLATVVFEIDWENQYESHGTPDMVTAMEEHLKETIKDTFGYEWDMEHDVAYVEGTAKIRDIKTVDLDMPSAIKPLPFCEHCGEGHEEFGCEFDVDGTSWCLNCYLSDKQGGQYVYSFYHDMVKRAEIKYLEKKLKELKKK